MLRSLCPSTTSVVVHHESISVDDDIRTWNESFFNRDGVLWFEYDVQETCSTSCPETMSLDMDSLLDIAKLEHKECKITWNFVKAPLEGRFSPKKLRIGWNFQGMLGLERVVHDKNFSPKYTSLRKLYGEKWLKLAQLASSTFCLQLYFFEIFF